MPRSTPYSVPLFMRNRNSESTSYASRSAREPFELLKPNPITAPRVHHPVSAERRSPNPQDLPRPFSISPSPMAGANPGSFHCEAGPSRHRWLLQAQDPGSANTRRTTESPEPPTPPSPLPRVSAGSPRLSLLPESLSHSPGNCTRQANTDDHRGEHQQHLEGIPASTLDQLKLQSERHRRPSTLHHHGKYSINER